MSLFKKYIAIFLLGVFTLAVVPAPFLHHIFAHMGALGANHIDAVDNHCRYYHKDLGRHIEESQNHCDVFKADTPVYDALKVSHEYRLSLIVISKYKASEVFSYSFAKPIRLPSRAPPPLA